MTYQYCNNSEEHPTIITQVVEALISGENTNKTNTKVVRNEVTAKKYNTNSKILRSDTEKKIMSTREWITKAFHQDKPNNTASLVK